MWTQASTLQWLLLRLILRVIQINVQYSVEDVEHRALWT